MINAVELGKIRLRARDELLKQLMSNLIPHGLIDSVYSDLLAFGDIGQQISSQADKSGSANKQWTSLLKTCTDCKNRLERLECLECLWSCISTALKDQSSLVGLKECFDAYKKAWSGASDTINPLFGVGNKLALEESYAEQLQKLRDLAERKKDANASRIQAAIHGVVNEHFRGMSIPHEFQLLLNQSFEQGWSDVLLVVQKSAAQERPIVMNNRLLEALEDDLAMPQAPVGRTVLTSLILMVIEPNRPGIRRHCTAYDFRAYFCENHEIRPDQGRRLAIEEAVIRKDYWQVDLQTHLDKAITMLGAIQRNSQQLLLECFLPTELLNAPIGSLLTTCLGDGSREPLERNYAFVLRSSTRFRRFVENGDPSKNPLEERWQIAPSRSLHWWHDQTPERRASADLHRKIIDEKFLGLRHKPHLFGFKRVASLPSGELLNCWLDALEKACPAVAIWWRPGSRRSRNDRNACLSYSPSKEVASCFGGSDATGYDPDPISDFSYSSIIDPLDLFYRLADAHLKGRTDGRHRSAFLDMVLMVDAPSRWPPALASSPFPQDPPDHAEAGEVLNATEEDILISPA